jgi:hypothetical protein
MSGFGGMDGWTEQRHQEAQREAQREAVVRHVEEVAQLRAARLRGEEAAPRRAAPPVETDPWRAIQRLAEENQRLATENRRLIYENGLLADENRRMAEKDRVRAERSDRL